MRFASISAILALAVSAFAQTADFDPVYVPTANEVVQAGSAFTIQWTAPAKYAAGTISISLIGGATQNTQVPLSVIATGVKNSANSYVWHVDAALGDQAVYGLVFKLESNPAVFQYSNPFHIKKGANVPTGTATKTATTAGGISSGTVTTKAPETTGKAPETTSKAAYTTTVIKDTTTTVPCNSTTLATSTRYTPPPPKYTAPSSVPVVIQTSTAWTAPTAPPHPSASAPAVTPTPIKGAGAQVGASSLALVGGLVMAFLAL